MFSDEDIQGSRDRSCQELVFLRAGELVPIWYGIALPRDPVRVTAGVQSAARSSSLLAVVELSGFRTIQSIRHPFGVLVNQAVSSGDHYARSTGCGRGRAFQRNWGMRPRL